MRFDGGIVKRCPLIPVRDNYRFFVEISALYAAREKHLFSEVGGYYDQPNAYNRIMAEMDGIVSDAHEQKRAQEEQERKDLDTIRKMINNKG